MTRVRGFNGCVYPRSVSYPPHSGTLAELPCSGTTQPNDPVQGVLRVQLEPC